MNISEVGKAMPLLAQPKHIDHETGFILYNGLKKNYFINS